MKAHHANHRRVWTLLLGAAVGSGAHAQSTPYFVGVSTSYTHYTNLLRLGDNDRIAPDLSKDDNVWTTSLLGGVDQTIGRQRVFGNASLRVNRYSKNDVYDNEGYTFSGGVDWQTVNNISGNVKLVANRNLASFNTTERTVQAEKNIENTRQADAAFRIGTVTVLSGEALVGWRQTKYSNDAYQAVEFNQRSGSLGMRYRPSSASDFGLAFRYTKGEYPNFFGAGVADQYDRRDIDFTANYVPTGASSVTARISYGKKDYDTESERNFTGVTGQLLWDWKPSGKWRLRTELSRDPGQDSYFFESPVEDNRLNTTDFSRVTTALGLTLDYEVTAKVSLTAYGRYAHRSLSRTDSNLLTQDLRSTEKETYFSLGAVWQALRSVQLGCNIGYEKRKGDAPLSSDLSATNYGCYGQFTLQL